jgi:hypothetical protein
MKRALRCHDFGSGREASCSQYVDIGKTSDKAKGQNSCQPQRNPLDIQISAPGLRPESTLTLSAGLVVYRILSCAVLRVIVDSGAQRTRVSLC